MYMWEMNEDVYNIHDVEQIILHQFGSLEQ